MNTSWSTFYTDEKITQALSAFRQLSITNPSDGDKFFETWCPGNSTSIIDRPYERFRDYEIFLEILKSDDKQKYEKIHKGTPFYFLAWTAFDLRNYEKAIFYMDAAISEDRRKDPINWLNNPASQFLTLNHLGNQTAVRITRHLRDEINTAIQGFNSVSKLPVMSVESFVDKFVKQLINKKANYSIITALYSFILEFEDREKELSLRSIDGGSIEPVLTHLFKGGLIFESLLKQLYPKDDNGNDCKTIGAVFHTNNFSSDFIPRIKTGANTLQEIITGIVDNDLQTAFYTTGKLRNAAGHNLVWDDIFNNSNNFRKLYEQQVNAIFYLIQKKFL